jgi:hypothetical protein
MQRHPTHNAVQWIGAALAALVYTVLMLVVFRPSPRWAAFVLVVAMLGFTFAFRWLFVERPAELKKKLGDSKEERRAASHETTPHAHWPPK